MIQRQIRDWLEASVDKPQVVHLTGMRQTGKTTLMNALKAGLAPTYGFDFQDLVTLRRYEDRPEDWAVEVETRIRASGRRIHIFVDEVQKVPALFQAIQGLYDRYKGKVKFWIYGSSARVLKRRQAETLAGRSLSRILYPLSQSELLARPSIVGHLFSRRLEGKVPPEPRGYTHTLCHWLTQTLLPEPCLLDRAGDAMELAENYIATYVENEIRRENIVSDVGVFNRFLTLLAALNGQVANYSRLASSLGISSHTVKSYVGLLEDTFVCRTLPAFSGSFHVQVAKNPKIYFADTALARLMADYRHPMRSTSPDFGMAVESFVINEIVKQVEYERLPWKLSYFRTKSGVEVDLVIESDREALAIEVKSGFRLRREGLQGIQKLMAMDRRVKRGILFCLSPGFKQLTPKIFSLPIWAI